jgi:hypothetical protein
MQHASSRRAVRDGMVLFVSAALLGVVLLPRIFGSLPDSPRAVVWLALSVVLCIALIVPTRTLATTLATGLLRLPGRARPSAVAQRASTEIARLVVAATYLVLMQAILRHPLVVVFGAEAEPFLVEALVAVVALLILLALLGWIYQAAKPIIEDLAWNALDAAFATSASEEAVRAASTIGPAVSSTRVAPTPTPDATLARE